MSDLVSADDVLNEAYKLNTASFNLVKDILSEVYHYEKASIKQQRKQEKEVRDKSIKQFADWCYINGIDFSYMSNSEKSGRQFLERVIEKYNVEQMKEETKLEKR